jgi:hypothetical protein
MVACSTALLARQKEARVRAFDEVIERARIIWRQHFSFHMLPMSQHHH